MDAAQTNFKKISLFLATALLLAAPFHASAQATVGASSTSVVIGSSSCNDYQNVTLTSSNSSALSFTVSVQYANGNPYGNWLYASVQGTGSTSNSSAFTASTGLTGVSLTIGLNLEIAAATPQATVVITPAGGGAPTNITVFYTQNTSCGGNTGSSSNGFFSVTPGNVALTAASNGQQAQTLTIQNTTGSGFTFQYSVSPANQWLSANAASLTLAPNGTASLNVTANAVNTAGAGTYNGIVTIESAQSGFGSAVQIPVVFTVTSGTTTGGGGSTGTLTVNGTTSTTYTDTFTYIAPTAPGGQCIPIQDTTPGANSYSSAVTTTNGGNWLLANNQIDVTTPQLLGSGNNACVELTLNPSVAYGLNSGAYQGSVALTSSSGATATINVNYYVSAGPAPGITVTPGLIYVFPNVAANSSVAQQQVFSLTGASGYALQQATLTNSAGGFSMSTPVDNNNTETFTVNSNSTGLVAGIYSTTVTMVSSYNGQQGTTTITIILPVGQSGTVYTGGGTSASTVAPLTLAFQQQLNSSFWTSGKEAQAITITGAQGTQWSAGIVYASGVNWLAFDSPTSASGTFGAGPATLLVDLSNGVTSLAASSQPYAATISINTPSGTQTVSVTLLVTATNAPVLLGLPASTSFAATTGVNPATQTVTVVGSDNTGSSTNPPITAGTPTASWLTATTSGNTMTISVSQTGLTTGVYAATIPVSATAYQNAIQYPVVLVVNGGGGTGTGSTGPLVLSSTALSFTNVTGQISQNLGITASTSTNFTAVSSETNCTSYTWLTIASGSYTASTTNTPISVTVNPSGITNGTTCNGVITLVSAASTQTVTVMMTVGTSGTGGSGNVTVSPTTMSFAYTQGQTVPVAQTATIVNTTTGTASIPFTVGTTEANGTSSAWLQTSATSGTTPDNTPGLSVSVVPGNLSPGTYNGTVTITPTGGTAQTIAVTMTITGTAIVSATPTTLSLTYLVGGTSPTGTIQVSASGATAGFTATAASSQGWLQVSPTSGTTATSGTNNLTVSVVPTVLSSLLPSGTAYTGTITVQGTSPATGTTIVNVSLSVTAPLPEITGITNAASGASGQVAPGEIISIYGTPANPIGPANAVQLNSSTCPSPCTQVPLTMGGVTVKFLPGNEVAPLLFVNQGQINAVVPYTVAGIAGLSVEVSYLGQTSNIFPVTLATAVPGLFTANASGTGQIAADQYDTNGNESTNTPAAPAKAGWTLVLYMTGEGSVSPQPANGAVTVYNANAIPPVPVPLAGVPHVLIGNQPATVTFYGEAPGLVSGVLQLNVVVPAGAGTGSVPISVSIGTGASQAGATVSLQ